MRCRRRSRLATRALHFAGTDWPAIAALYAQLARIAPSPVVELNRAVAVSRAEGAADALPIVEALAADAKLSAYAPLHTVRGDLLATLGRNHEARVAFAQAAALTGNIREREVLLARAATCSDAPAVGA